VVSVTLMRNGQPLEGGRMGPGEVIGEAGIVAEQAALANFSAKTFCTLYRIENSYLKPCLEARRDINDAMKNLLDVRMHLAQNLTRDVPKPVAKKRFLQWLRSRV
jgi:CRP-like cAMP-binding protein